MVQSLPQPPSGCRNSASKPRRNPGAGGCWERRQKFGPITSLQVSFSLAHSIIFFTNFCLGWGVARKLFSLCPIFSPDEAFAANFFCSDVSWESPTAGDALRAQTNLFVPY